MEFSSIEKRHRFFSWFGILLVREYQNLQVYYFHRVIYTFKVFSPQPNVTFVPSNSQSAASFEGLCIWNAIILVPHIGFLTKRKCLKLVLVLEIIALELTFRQDFRFSFNRSSNDDDNRCDSSWCSNFFFSNFLVFSSRSQSPAV